MDLLAIIEQYIWFALGGAALLGFVFAWIIRGFAASGHKRRATVERDVALTELEQVRSELDSLYAAQRKQRETGGVVPAAAPDNERLARMARELESTRAELVALKDARETVAPTTPADDEASEDIAELRARNQQLEDQVADLGAQVESLQSAKVEPSAANDEPEAKAEWQADYLKTRVAALEEKLLQAGPAPAPADEDAVAQPLVADEELARLRWRNRYLEGRLAYYEEAPEETETSEQEAGEVSPSPEPAPDLPVDVTDEKDGTVLANGADAAEETAEEGEHPADRMLKALDAKGETAAAQADGDAVSAIAPEKPEGVDAANGAPDDLTLITGVGPRIQSILNDHGIWHFSQIAKWSESNEAWIDRELNLAGRIGREGWVRQARELAGASAES